MAARAVFLDRDGTINIDRGYVHRVEDFVFLPGAVDGLRLLHRAGYLLVVITNQSGIARGLFSENDFKLLDSWMRRMLAEKGAPIAATYYCPHHPDFTGRCGCRKPSLDMFYQAANDYEIDLDLSWAIGDSRRDLGICDHSACRGILIGNNVLQAPSGAIVCDNLLDAALVITERAYL